MLQVTDRQARQLIEDGLIHRVLAPMKVYKRKRQEQEALQEVSYAKFLRRLRRAVSGR